MTGIHKVRVVAALMLEKEFAICFILMHIIISSINFSHFQERGTQLICIYWFNMNYVDN